LHDLLAVSLLGRQTNVGNVGELHSIR
jgi:hypothetical protein